MVDNAAGVRKLPENNLDLDNYFPFLLKTISEYISQGTHNQQYDGHSIGIREWRVLSLLAVYGSVSAKHVVFFSGMDKATVSRAVTRLKKYGLIKSKPDPENWRFQILVLTDEGLALYNRIAPEKMARAKEMRKGLTDEEHEQLIHLLQKLKQSVIEALDIEVPDVVSHTQNRDAVTKVKAVMGK